MAEVSSQRAKYYAEIHYSNKIARSVAEKSYRIGWIDSENFNHSKQYPKLKKSYEATLKTLKDYEEKNNILMDENLELKFKIKMALNYEDLNPYELIKQIKKVLE